MFTVTFKLDASKRQIDVFNKRFFVYCKLKNTEIKEAQKRIRVLERDKTYMNARKEYIYIKHNLKNSKENQKRCKELSSEMSVIRNQHGLNNNDLKVWIKPMRNKYENFISSQQGQSISEEVWKAVEDYLFDDGKALHLKKYCQTDSIPQTTNFNGVRIDLNSETMSWLGEECSIKIKHDNYINEVLTKKFKYGYIKRKMFSSGYKYYVSLIFDGEPPIKYKSSLQYVCGFDVGTSTVAFASDNKCYLDNLAPSSEKYSKKIIALDRKIERSLRLNNPENYNKDGIAKKANRYFKPVWKVSKNCKRLKRQRKTLFRKQAESTLHSHRRQINTLLSDVKQVNVEPMNFKSLQKRSSKTEKSDKTVLTKSGKTVTKFKRKKRFGKSLSVHSPGKFMEVLKYKCKLLSIEYNEIDSYKVKASQFDHVSKEYNKPKLSERNKIVGGHQVQRDLYSAFLIKNTDESLSSVDIDKCNEQFNSFLINQNKRIDYMKANSISNKSCFGF